MNVMSVEVWQMWAVFSLIIGAVFLYSRDDITLEMTSLLILSSLLVFFFLFPVLGPDGRNLLTTSALLQGFANPALIAVLALLVVGEGMFQTGALDGPAKLIADYGVRAPKATIITTFIIIAVVSAFLNNTPVAVMFIPVLATLATRLQMHPAKVMMPLSYVSILGGMTTLIGSSTNLLAGGVVVHAGLPAIQIFDFVIPGLFLASIGLIYSIFIAPKMLPERAGPTSEIAGSTPSGDGKSGKQYIAQIGVTHGNPLVGAKSTSGLFPPLKDMTVRMIQRGEHAILPPFEDVELRPGDEIIVAATRQTLTDALRSGDKIFESMLEERFAEGAETEGPAKPAGELTIVEAVVAPASRMVGQTVEQIAFHTATGCIVIGIQRRSRMIRTRLDDIRLEAGDVLLILGKRGHLQALRHNRDIFLLEWSATDLPDPRKARRALGIFALMIIGVLAGGVPIEVMAVMAAAAAIGAGVLNIRQATQAIDRRIFLLVGATIALSTALEATGGAQAIASATVETFATYGPAVIMSALFLVGAIITNVLSNNATAVLLTPIAISTARELHLDPMPFVYGVIFAANCSFATPMGYQTNLLVMGPGHYTFRDFVKAGSPLVILIWLAYSLFAPWYYGI